tara:strand:- start:1973 stop:2650 length:678 start_codon:yes stop_codon:yes gene_type:complete
MEVLKFIAHSKKAVCIAAQHGWYPGARYTNLRDVKTFDFEGFGFLDIDWKNYDFSRHIDAASQKKPKMTIARDVECIFKLDHILREAEQLALHSEHVAIVPKDPLLNGRIGELIPSKYILGYSVPTRYGGTNVSLQSFDRPVHLLGGRPDVQRQLAEKLKVISFDCNRFTFDARFGDYFDGQTFRPHPEGGYENCLIQSLRNINKLWDDYVAHDDVKKLARTVVL